MTTQTTDTSFKSEFELQKQQNVDMVKQNAQRLVNLYHHANSFGDHFMADLDKELSTLDSKTQTALSDILGGTVVRKYCEFLQKKTDSKTTDTKSSTEPQHIGYLPTPDKDEVIPDMPTTEGMNTAQITTLLKQLMSTHQEELEKILSAQSDSLSQLMKNANQTTHEMASHQTDRLIHAIQKGADAHYSDVIESTTPQTPVLVPDEMEGF